MLFDALRPFKSQPEEFTPRDTLPWPRLAENLLRTSEPEKAFYFITPPNVVEVIVNSLIKNLTLPPQAAILDIGCGMGGFSYRLAQLGYKVTGIDIAQPFLDYAKMKAQQANLTIVYKNLSMFEIDFESQFDVVLSLNTLTKRLTLLELQNFLPQIHHALKPNGYVIADFCLLQMKRDFLAPVITESMAFFKESAWATEFHVWMVRDLVFPVIQERVNHHLILTETGIEEYWSHFTLHHQSILEDLFIAQKFQIKSFLDHDIKNVLPNKGEFFSLIWAEKLI